MEMIFYHHSFPTFNCQIFGFKYDKFHVWISFCFSSRPRFEITNQFSFDNLQFFIRCCITLMIVFKRIMFLPWSHYRDSKWHLFISYEYSNFKKKNSSKTKLVFLHDSMEFIIRQIQISLRKKLLLCPV